MIQWTEITWYSRIAAIIFFVGVLPVLNFYIGVQYQQTNSALEASVAAQDPAPLCPIIPAGSTIATTSTSVL